MAAKNKNRQMTRTEKRDAIKAKLSDAPTLSDRVIARSIGCSHVTVYTIRNEMIAKGQLERIDTTSSQEWYSHPYVLKNPSMFVGSDNDPKCVEISQERVEAFFKEKYAEDNSGNSDE